MKPVWSRPSVYGPIAPTPAENPTDPDAEARRLALAGVHPASVKGPLNRVLTAARGDVAEERVLRLLTHGKLPAWLLSARRTRKNSAEDRQGADIVCTSDAGDLRLQVKSSEGGARNFERRRKHLPGLRLVAVVVAPPEDADAEILERAILALADLRERLLAGR